MAKEAPLKKNKVNFKGRRFMLGLKNSLAFEPALSRKEDDMVRFLGRWSFWFFVISMLLFVSSRNQIITSIILKSQILHIIHENRPGEVLPFDWGGFAKPMGRYERQTKSPHLSTGQEYKLVGQKLIVVLAWQEFPSSVRYQSIFGSCGDFFWLGKVTVSVLVVTTALLHVRSKPRWYWRLRSKIGIHFGPYLCLKPPVGDIFLCR